jgi:hypothetical protein
MMPLLTLGLALPATYYCARSAQRAPVPLDISINFLSAAAR